MIFWNLFSCKGTWMIDWVGRLLHLVLLSHDTSCLLTRLVCLHMFVFWHMFVTMYLVSWHIDVSGILTYRVFWHLSCLLTHVLDLLSCAHVLIIYLVHTSCILCTPLWSSILCPRLFGHMLTFKCVCHAQRTRPAGDEQKFQKVRSIIIR